MSLLSIVSHSHIHNIEVESIEKMEKVKTDSPSAAITHSIQQPGGGDGLPDITEDGDNGSDEEEQEEE